MKVQQLLHGYNQGHNLLAGSIVIASSVDMDRMMALSDWSEFENPIDADSSYITAYPLPDSSYYAVAKTWYASEMKRPGCIWTHTLLLDINDLENGFDIRMLMSMFIRPSVDEYDDYCREIIVDNSKIESPLFDEAPNIPCIGLLYQQLIENKEPLIFRIERSSYFYQVLCLVLMRHIPAQILKDLSFCTGSAKIRSINGKPMNLQFLSTNINGSRSLILKEDLSEDNHWLSPIITSIQHEKNEIPTLLQLYSSDIENNLLKFKSLMKIFLLIDETQNSTEPKTEQLRNIISFLAAGFPLINEGLKLKKRFLQKDMTQLFCNESTFIYEMATTKSVSSFDYSFFNFNARVESLFNLEKASYVFLLENLSNTANLNDAGKSILVNSTKLLSSTDLCDIMHNHWTLFMSLISIEFTLLNSDEWLSLNKPQFKEVLILFESNIPENYKFWKSLFQKILAEQISISSRLAEIIKDNIQETEPYILDFLYSNPNSILCESIFRKCITNIGTVLDWMKNRTQINYRIIQLIIKMVPPQSSIVIRKGSSVWNSFYKYEATTLPLEYYTYLFVLSYNWQNDANAFFFYRRAFYPIYNALKESELEHSLWDHIAPFTKPLIFWQEWDKCKKLRNGLIDRMKDEGYSKDILSTFTPDRELNRELKRLYRKR